MSLICKKAIMLAFYDERPNHIQHRKLGAWLVNCRRRYLLINNFEGSSVRDVDMGPVGHWGTESATKGLSSPQNEGKGQIQR